jgi:hypothetical protein
MQAGGSRAKKEMRKADWTSSRLDASQSPKDDSPAPINATTPSASMHIRRLPTLQQVFGAGGTLSKKTQYTYEESAYPLAATTTIENNCSLFNTVVNKAGGNTGACAANTFPATAPTPGPGNATTIQKYITSASSIPFHSQFNWAGGVVTSYDGKNQATTITYSSPDFACATSVQKGTFGYQQTCDTANSGLLTSRTDFNGITTTLAYNDPLDRPTARVAASNSSTVKTQKLISYSSNNTVITTQDDQNSFADAAIVNRTIRTSKWNWTRIWCAKATIRSSKKPWKCC